MDDAQKNIETAKLELERTSIRLDYLTRQYGFYTSHMNQVFNFYLVASALIASAFVQSLAGSNPLETWGSRGIGMIGAILSLVFLLLHLRGFQIAGLLEDEIKEIETAFDLRFMLRRKQSQTCVDLLRVLFPRKPDAPQKSREPNCWTRNTVFFTVVYLIFLVAFIVASCEVDSLRREQTRSVQINVSQTLDRMRETKTGASNAPDSDGNVSPRPNAPVPPAPTAPSPGPVPIEPQ